MTPTFVRSWVDFDLAHLSVFMVWRLPYLEIPALTELRLELGSQVVIGLLILTLFPSFFRSLSVSIFTSLSPSPLLISLWLYISFPPSPSPPSFLPLLLPCSPPFPLPPLGEGLGGSVLGVCGEAGLP